MVIVHLKKKNKFLTFVNKFIFIIFFTVVCLLIFWFLFFKLKLEIVLIFLILTFLIGGGVVPLYQHLRDENLF
jgi:hypothetical protein